jgi:hypothetical protein
MYIDGWKHAGKTNKAKELYKDLGGEVTIEF